MRRRYCCSFLWCSERMYTSPGQTHLEQERVEDVPVSYGLWEWGWTRNAEIWNGRMAMLGFFAVLLGVMVCR